MIIKLYIDEALGRKNILMMFNKGFEYNAIVFDNLEGYVEYLRWQKSKNIRCPVLYLQISYNAQGEPSYKIRPDILEPQDVELN